MMFMQPNFVKEKCNANLRITRSLVFALPDAASVYD
jgi:hypothetical protein